MKPNYRPDIDGLRALAVLSVIFYHADLTVFSGGYVGVDVFFVISGYLITLIITREIVEENFSIAKFYERRIRRIFPALFMIIFVFLIVGLVIFSPNELNDLSNTVASTVLFISNILFWTETDYFNHPSEFSPLLHTWSLAVEEQFYIVYPLFLVFIAKFFNARFFPWVFALLLASLAINIYSVTIYPTATFYLAHTRAWELMLGSVIALGVLPKPAPYRLRNTISLLGLTAILISIFTYTRSTPFPGIAAVLPTAGAAMMIYAGTGGKNLGGRILGNRAMVFVGLISYSLYLWHWPLIVYAKYLAIRPLHAPEVALLLFLTFMLSVLSWRYIERPFRSKHILQTSKHAFVFAATLMASAFAFALIIHTYDGFPQRSDTFKYIETVEHDPLDKKWEGCYIAKGGASINNLCHLGTVESEPTFLLWGDSHAASLATGLSNSAKEKMASGLLAIRAGCAPLLGIQRYPDKSCYNHNETMITYLKYHPEISIVVLAGRWALYENSSPYKQEKGVEAILSDVATGQRASGKSLLPLGLQRTIDAIHKLDRRIFIVSQVPEIGYDVPAAYSVALRTNRDIGELIAPTIEEYRERNKVVLETLHRLDSTGSVEVIDPASMLCNTERCHVLMNGSLLYSDHNHLSNYGSEYLSPLFRGIFSASH